MKYFLFGYKHLYFKAADEKQWRIVTKPEQENDQHQAWVPNRTTPSGKVWFDGFSHKIGLSDDQDIQQFSAELLDEMLEITATEQSLCFFPPYQMANLESVIAATKDPARITALPEYLLLNDAQPQNTTNMNFAAQDNCYIRDWKTSNQGIICNPDLLTNQPAQTFFAPVLMPATALEKQQEQIIGRIKQDHTLELHATQLTIPVQAVQGSRPPVLGLVWVWGWGKRLWQWAMPYTQLHETVDSNQRLLKQMENSFELQLYRQENPDPDHTFKLNPPVYNISH